MLITILLMMLTEATLGASVVSALAFQAIGFLVGDLLILPRTNNTIATLADVGMALAYFWLAASMADWELNFLELLTHPVHRGRRRRVGRASLVSSCSPRRKVEKEPSSHRCAELGFLFSLLCFQLYDLLYGQS